MGGGLGALRFFGHLKRELELLISVRMSPLASSVDTITHGKKNKKRNKEKTNKDASVISLLAKNVEFCIFCQKKDHRCVFVVVCFFFHDRNDPVVLEYRVRAHSNGD